MRLLLFALAAVASAQLEHSVGEALSWKSLRRAALGDKGAEQLEETLEIGGKSDPRFGPPVVFDRAQITALSDGRFTYDGPSTSKLLLRRPCERRAVP